MFTDYGYDAVALPRNRELPGNRNAASFDLGLCERKDAKTPSNDEKWCSSFRTPSLRNVAVRESFGHNGVYKKLREVVAFYALRAVAPGRIYPPGQKFDDVPAEVSRQRQHLRPHLQPAGGRPAAAVRRGHRRGRGLPGDLDRRALCLVGGRAGACGARPGARRVAVAVNVRR